MVQTLNAKILAIETSCDECAAAVVARTSTGVKVFSNQIFSQIDLHKKFGGVVPEVASRNHLEMINTVIEDALTNANTRFQDLAAIAVTNRPGLIGALLVGVSTAKTLAYALNLPLIPVHHLEGHIHSIFIDDQIHSAKINQHSYPMVIALVSGGHTNLYLASSPPEPNLNLKLLATSRDDAAGEAFDKCAKLLGLPYPGGKHLNQLAAQGNSSAYSFPQPLPGPTLEFSFSGLKTAVLTQLKNDKFTPHIFGDVNKNALPQDAVLYNYCAAIQEAIVQTLLRKISLALQQTRAKSLALVGGVSANTRLRALLTQKIKVPVYIPNFEYCTDNAAMIGAAAAYQFANHQYLSNDELLSLNAYSS